MKCSVKVEGVQCQGIAHRCVGSRGFCSAHKAEAFTAAASKAGSRRSASGWRSGASERDPLDHPPILQGDRAEGERSDDDRARGVGGDDPTARAGQS